MTITMDDSRITTIEEIQEFLKSAGHIRFEAKNREEIYEWIENTFVKFRYGLIRKKKDRGVIKRYIEKVTGYSRAQVTRLSGQYRETGKVQEREYEKHIFPKIYSPADILLLAETDELHDFPNGAAVQEILERMYFIYEQKEYENIAQISVGHIYNLRASPEYLRITKRYEKTKPHIVNIGERVRPDPNGQPGYVRVDTVHQGDEGNGRGKGVYHINSIDEVTQWECIGAVEKISEAYLIPVLLKLIGSYPFEIVEFHTDNGSEYINRQVVDMLNRLLIKLTKSRSRQSNDNALVETKNGWVIRKWIGYGFIKQEYADKLNEFYGGCFNEYLNYHRPCGFATEIKDGKGKIRKVYKQEDYMTPYDKLKLLPDFQRYLKLGVTAQYLETIAMRKTDNEMAQEVQTKRYQLFEQITSKIPYS